MALMLEFNTAGGTITVDPDWVTSIGNEAGVVSIYVLGWQHIVTDAHADVVGAVNLAKVNGIGRPIQVKVGA